MKIGLLTYHHSVSYGATLQTYATCRVLKQLGHEVTLINLPLHNGGRKLSKILFYLRDRNTQKLWRKFYPPTTRLFHSSEELRSEKFSFDYLIVGSDQTWNPQINCSLCTSFFLDFGDENMKRISYASSFGISEWPAKYDNLVSDIKKLLSRFDAISTREVEGQRLLKDKFGFDSTLVIDPTLLNVDYSELTGEIKPNNKLICFTMNRTPQQLERVRELATNMGEKPYQMATIYKLSGFRYIYPPSIPEWLRLIAGAKFVVTDSFHGLVFCLIYHKQFVVITPDNGRNSRMQNLLRVVGLEDRFYNENDDIPYTKLKDEIIDYSKVDDILAIEREKSMKFLIDSLA